MKQVEYEEAENRKRSQANIILSVNNNQEVMVFPVVPEINVSKPQDNTTFETINNGTMNLIGDEGLRTFNVSSIFPCREYSWLKIGSVSDGFAYVDFINRWRSKKYPFRIYVSRPDGREWFNMAVLIDAFDFSVMRNGDIKYSLSFSEYRFVKVKVS
ncbi:hypothetical protein EUAN_06870 [Andreesenia angusta]|uniref:Uncharacterized protein n=1 Tax=Andreesenia angusta TaxID=39480 RepID=A0A1S1V8H3_9FIRM|nr:hypothetical protein [Andreesenia angusta]OHW62903.1 hypothetical protein EUAN_06870 [Andreesenia angusta]